MTAPHGLGRLGRACPEACPAAGKVPGEAALSDLSNTAVHLGGVCPDLRRSKKETRCRLAIRRDPLGHTRENTAPISRATCQPRKEAALWLDSWARRKGSSSCEGRSFHKLNCLPNCLIEKQAPPVFGLFLESGGDSLPKANNSTLELKTSCPASRHQLWGPLVCLPSPPASSWREQRDGAELAQQLAHCEPSPTPATAPRNVQACRLVPRY